MTRRPRRIVAGAKRRNARLIGSVTHLQPGSGLLNSPVMTSDFNTLTGILGRLGKVIKTRRTEDPKNSYVAAKLAKGVEHCAKKVGEEAVETALAAVQVQKGKTERVVSESADLLFHLLILWEAVGVTPKEVAKELEGREGISGHDEKAGRDD